MTMELGGKVTIDCEKTNYRAELEFKLKDNTSGLLYDGEVHINELKNGNAEVFWNPTSEVRKQRLKRHIVLFEEQTDFESERLWQHVTSAINKGDQHKATQEKFVLEEEQRNAARERRENGTEWKPLLFQHDSTTNEWRYKYEDLRPWDPLNDIAQFEKNGILQTMERHLSTGMYWSAQLVLQFKFWTWPFAFVTYILLDRTRNLCSPLTLNKDDTIAFFFGVIYVLSIFIYCVNY
uniref:Uncharacterized protein n=1 Tax=Pavo cristatus TaxID=9049 RepID=A0A8C9FQN2_PAVCR